MPNISIMCVKFSRVKGRIPGLWPGSGYVRGSMKAADNCQTAPARLAPRERQPRTLFPPLVPPQTFGAQHGIVPEELLRGETVFIAF